MEKAVLFDVDGFLLYFSDLDGLVKETFERLEMIPPKNYFELHNEAITKAFISAIAQGRTCSFEHMQPYVEETFPILKEHNIKGNTYLELPAQHLTLVSAFNDKGKRVKKQIFMPVKLGNVCIDQVFIISPQLLTSAILGVDFFINTRAIINFPERCAVFKHHGKEM